MSKSHKGTLEEFMDYDVHLPTKTLYMGSDNDHDGEESGTDYKMAEKVIKGLHLLEWTDPSKTDINIIMNNIGGAEVHGMAIYNAIRSCKAHVTIRVNGHATSMGSVILQAADERLMHEDSEFMIHYGAVTISGTPKDHERWAKAIKKNAEKMEQIFLDKIRIREPEYSIEKLRSKLSADWIIYPKEALKLNLIDGIIKPNGTIERYENKDD